MSPCGNLAEIQIVVVKGAPWLIVYATPNAVRKEDTRRRHLLTKQSQELHEISACSSFAPEAVGNTDKKQVREEKFD